MKLNQLIAQYVVFRKSLGAKFEGNETVLHTFCRVVGEGRHVGKVRPHEVASFLDGCGPVTRHWHRKYIVLRDLSWVRIRGKGNKLRNCPLWPQTVYGLRLAIEGREPAEHVFLNRYGRPLTRFGVYHLVKRHVARVRGEMPSLATKNVSPHTVSTQVRPISSVAVWTSTPYATGSATFPSTRLTSMPQWIWKPKPKPSRTANQK